MTVGAPIGVAIGRPIGRLIGAGADGSWSANFLAGEFPSNITFTRASSAQDFNNPALTYSTNTTALNSSGFLVQGARTNLLLNSATLSTQNVTTTATAYTLSFYGTGTITLSGTSTAGPLVGTGASNRVTLTFTPTAGTLTLTVTGTVTQAQLEAGAFASSYIPTTSTTATRAEDTATVSSPYANQGTFVVEYTIPNGWASGTPEQGILHLWDGTNNNRIQLSRSSTGNIQFFINTGGVLQASIVDGGGVRTTPGTFRTAITFAENNFAISTNGATAQTDVSGTVPVVTSLLIGRAGSGGASRLFGYMRRVVYYPYAVSASQLQALSAV